MTPFSIYKIYFSPTGTTKKIVDTIGDELSRLFAVITKTYDFTLPIRRQSFPEISSEDIVVFGLPTYAGRLPNLLLDYLDTINGNSAFAIPVVTFGNRAYDNALVELKNLLEQHDFMTIGAGAFSCEHSFSYTLAAGRPDERDIAFAKDFASKMYDKILKVNINEYEHTAIHVDGDALSGYYQPQTNSGVKIDIRKVKPKTSSTCIKCGLCAESCPMGSISFVDFSEVTGICIKCGACVKKCPTHAKYFDDEGYLYHKTDLEKKYMRRAKNKIFI